MLEDGVRYGGSSAASATASHSLARRGKEEPQAIEGVWCGKDFVEACKSLKVFWVVYTSMESDHRVCNKILRP